MKFPAAEKIRRFFTVVAALAVLGFNENAFAHAPFDCTARVIVHADSAEVMVTVGTTLGENFLRAAGLDPRRLPNGHLFTLPPGLATNFFAVAADGKFSVARAASVIGDGLEFQFDFEYAIAAPKTLRLQSLFLPALASPRTVALVLTDENGNVFGSGLLAPGKAAAEFALPEKLFPQAATAVFAPATATNLSAAKIISRPTERKPQLGFGEFLRLGIFHILNVSAFDHLLFLAALLLGCRTLKTMLLVITGFTLAHSFTLALAALNLVAISARLVEPAIAASIIFVAAENFRRTEKSWLRYALTCGFGFIHGFGFASALRASGLGGTGAEIAMPLFTFNLGVEIGQLAVAAVAFPLLFALRKQVWFEKYGVRVISALVILVAIFWFCQRIVSFGGNGIVFHRPNE